MRSQFVRQSLSLAGMLVGLMVAAGTLNAQQQEQSTPAHPPNGFVNVEASRVYTFVDKTGFGHQHGIEGKLESGSLLMGAAANAGTLVFDMRSFDADTNKARRYVGLSGSTSASTRVQVNENMKGAAILNVAKYPTATFEVSSALPSGKTTQSGLPVFELKGMFTLHGVKRPLTVEANVEQQQGWLHVRGRFVISQTAYGITPFSKAFGAIGVADPLRIHGDLWVAPNPEIAMANIPSRK